MSEIGKNIEITEVDEQKSDANYYKEIKPKGNITPNESRKFWDDLFGAEISGNETLETDMENLNESDNAESDLENMINEYFDDLKSKSECPETIPDRSFESSDLEKLSPDEVAEKREEFDEKKAELKRQWEETNGRPWPKYEQDVYSSNNKLIRKAGSDYDAHHIQPLGMGGKNEVNNITPLHAEVHYDKQGVHSTDSPYSKLDKMLGGIEL